MKRQTDLYGVLLQGDEEGLVISVRYKQIYMESYFREMKRQTDLYGVLLQGDEEGLVISVRYQPAHHRHLQNVSTTVIQLYLISIKL